MKDLQEKNLRLTVSFVNIQAMCLTFKNFEKLFRRDFPCKTNEWNILTVYLGADKNSDNVLVNLSMIYQKVF